MNIVILMTACMLLASCHVFRLPIRDVHVPVNQRDFQWRINTMTVSQKLSSFPLIQSYRSTWGKVFFSECKNLPSDSTYFMIHTNKHCHGTTTLLRTMGRLLREHDLHISSPFPPLPINGRNAWIDLNLECGDNL